MLQQASKATKRLSPGVHAACVLHPYDTSCMDECISSGPDPVVCMVYHWQCQHLRIWAGLRTQRCVDSALKSEGPRPGNPLGIGTLCLWHICNLRELNLLSGCQLCCCHIACACLCAVDRKQGKNSSVSKTHPNCSWQTVGLVPLLKDGRLRL